MKQFDWVWNDPSHLDAHRHDFRVEPEEVLSRLYPEVASLMPDPAEIPESDLAGPECILHLDFELGEPVGWTGLRNVCEGEDESFWGYRRGRDVPSHLCVGEKELTHWVCLWGKWEPGRFVIFTLYPGRVAPREIHDHALPPEEIQRSIEFWRCHAIVVGEDEFTMRPARG